MMKHLAAGALALALVAGTHAAPARAEDHQVTFATFNASLNRDEEGTLIRDLSTRDNAQARNAAETIQRSHADVILVNEFDHDADGKAVDLFRTNYLEVSQRGADPVEYPYAWSGPVNTGVPSGHDLNNDGTVGGPDDAYGFGQFPGQYGFVVYSKYPIKADDVRTFQTFLWKDMPDNMIPADWYTDEELADVRLSSKTHADVPVDVHGQTVHVLAAHPTPPSFDGPEQRNKRRNNDEIRLWADYVSGKADYLHDDEGRTGGLPAGSRFVILGDYNSDPLDGDSVPGSIDQLLKHPRIIDPKATSEGAVEAAKQQGGANETHQTDPALDTADFADDPRPGNIRVDYTLLSKAGMSVQEAGVFWPVASDPLSRLTGTYPFPTSDHRLVWVRATLQGADPAPTPPGPSPSAPAPAPSAPTPAPSAPDASPAPTTPAPSRPGLPSTGC
ncbi:endonuclease/exonuclease/phosphatase family protein [uncultured Tessaracoccus sp.]|uniref:endonuclease/exonuclease/phosphatase family protein n=1 Tax=uncultured Tessaracoccus sp. TaxID=905023 RepID=UPI0025FF7E29|nr:endonuclease/exonuclease/phosphatase family protein [uncultured Tessaracoccus sp.]